MRVGIIGLLQESNTFVPAKTGLAEFEADAFAIGDAVRERFADAPHEIGGFFAGLDKANVEAVPLFAARALPNGVIDALTCDCLRAEISKSLRRAGPLDGLLVAPHGATVGENLPDFDGHWLALARTFVGSLTPIIGTIDPHANLSRQMVDACDALIAYRTNPHVDQRERGEEAARLLARTLREEVRPMMVAACPPLAINIACQATEELPCRELCELCDEVRQSPGVLSTSLVLGFPYADVTEMGSSVIVVSDGDRNLAVRQANRIAETMWRMRHQFVGSLVGIDEAIDQSLPSEGPVCLLDMGDNVGAGSPADSTWLAEALITRGVSRSLVVVDDPAAAQTAAAAGVGARVHLRIGGKSGPLSGRPLSAGFIVRGVFDGHFQESEPTHGGFTSFDQGLSAVVSSDSGLMILITSKRMVPFSLAQLTSCGVDPASFRIIVAKGVNAPIAAYSKVCRTFIRVDTPGVTAADMTKLSHQRRRVPMFPFEPDCTWSAEDCRPIG